MKITNQSKHPRRARGFTLIELLTVIAIIGILAAILIPVVSRVRMTTASSKSASNLRQIGTALTLYLNDHGDRMPARQTWHVEFLPYLGFDVEPGGPFPKNLEDIFFHPRDIQPPRDDGGPRRSYAINNPAWDGNFPSLSGMPFSRIHTPSHLMVFTERPNQGGYLFQSSNGSGIAWPENHFSWQRDLNGDGVYNYAFADGHVETRRFDDPFMIGERGDTGSGVRGAWRPDWLTDTPRR